MGTFFHTMFTVETTLADENDFMQIGKLAGYRSPLAFIFCQIVGLSLPCTVCVQLMECQFMITLLVSKTKYSYL